MTDCSDIYLKKKKEKNVDVEHAELSTRNHLVIIFSF